MHSGSMKKCASWLIAALAVLALLSTAHAAEWAERPVKLLVPSTPGARPDVFARILAEKLQEEGIETILVRGAGGTELSEHIREILLTQTYTEPYRARHRGQKQQ